MLTVSVILLIMMKCVCVRAGSLMINDTTCSLNMFSYRHSRLKLLPQVRLTPEALDLSTSRGKHWIYLTVVVFRCVFINISFKIYDIIIEQMVKTTNYQQIHKLF